MKRVTEQIGKNTEEAIRKGLEELKVSRDDVKIEVLEEEPVLKKEKVNLKEIDDRLMTIDDFLN